MALDEGSDHSLGLFALVLVGDDARLGSIGHDRPGLIAALVTEDGVGHGHDLGGRAVVVGQLEDRDRAEELTQPVEQRGVGTVPSVDGLVGVADHTEVSCVTEQGTDQPELRGVHVLELVDGQVTVSPSHALGEALVVGQQVGCSDQQVVEVEAAALVEGRLVGTESHDHGVGLHRNVSRTRCDRGCVVVGTEAASLGPSDLAGKHGGDCGIFAQLAENARAVLEDRR